MKGTHGVLASVLCILAAWPAAAKGEDVDGRDLAVWQRTLDSPDIAVRLKAVELALSLGPKARALLPLLIRRFEDPDPAVYQGAVKAAASMDLDAAPLLAEQLSRPSTNAQRGAAYGLWRLSQGLQRDRNRHRNRMIIDGRRLQIDPRLEAPCMALARSLHSPDSYTAAVSALALARIFNHYAHWVGAVGKTEVSSFSYLIKNLSPEHLSQIRAALEAYGHGTVEVEEEKPLPSGTRVPPGLLVRGKGRTIFWTVFEEVVHTLSQTSLRGVTFGVKTSGGLEFTVSGVNHPTWFQHQRRSLSMFVDREISPGLRALVGAQKRIVAVLAANLDHPGLLAPICKGLRDLGSRAQPAETELRRRLDLGRPKEQILLTWVLSWISPCEKATVMSLLRAASSGREEVGWQVVGAFCRMGVKTPQALALFRKGLRCPQGGVRDVAAAGLLKMGKAAGPAVPELLRALDDPFSQIRTTASRVFQRLGIDALPRLTAILERDPSVKIQQRAVERIGTLGPRAREAEPLLRHFSETTTGRLRRSAILAWKNVCGVRAVSALLLSDLTTGDRAQAQWAQVTFRALGTEGARELIRVLGESPLPLRDRVVRAIEAMGAAAVRPLSACLSSGDEGTAVLAAQILGRMGSRARDAVKDLEKACEGDSLSLNLAASKALCQIQGRK